MICHTFKSLYVLIELNEYNDIFINRIHPCILNTKFTISSDNEEGMAIAKLESRGYQRQNKHSQMKETAIVKKLHREFPEAEMGIVRDVVQWYAFACSFNYIIFLYLSILSICLIINYYGYFS